MRINTFFSVVFYIFTFQVISAQYSSIDSLKSMRIDYYLSGNLESYSLSFRKAYIISHHTFNPASYLSTNNLGSNKIEICDSASGVLLYTKSFCTLFDEWLHSSEANIINKSFEQSICIPLPNKSFYLKFYDRDSLNNFQLKDSFVIQPESYFNETFNINTQYSIIHKGNDPKKALDIAFIAEGFTLNQMESFKSQTVQLTKFLLETEPFSKYKNKINCYAIESPSIDSGADVPASNSWKNTALESSFYTFDCERYIMTTSYFKTMDFACNTPFDIIVILVNTDIYGGGGIFNHYATVTTKNEYNKTVVVHELGHLLAGLADEYTGNGMTSSFYKLNVEPWEPNITNLIDFKSKWQYMLNKNTPIPTPDNKKYLQSLGVFEGAGYLTKGMYRPAVDCRMHSNEAKSFCRVCEHTLENMLLYYCK